MGIFMITSLPVWKHELARALLTVVSSYLFSWEICLHSTVSTLRRAAFYWTLTAASVGQPRHRNSLGLTFMVIWVSHPMGWFRPHAFLKRKEHVFPGRVTAETSWDKFPGCLPGPVGSLFSPFTKQLQSSSVLALCRGPISNASPLKTWGFIMISQMVQG